MSDELRFEIIRGMLIEFPQLKERVKEWLLENEAKEFDAKALSKE